MDFRQTRAGIGLVLALVAGAATAGEVMSPDYGAVTYRPAPSGAGTLIEVKSLHGWSCSGVYAPPARAGEAVDFPLDCSDDVKGKALMSVEDGRAAILFQRKDGSKGSAAFRME